MQPVVEQLACQEKRGAFFGVEEQVLGVVFEGVREGVAVGADLEGADEVAERGFAVGVDPLITVVEEEELKAGAFAGLFEEVFALDGDLVLVGDEGLDEDLVDAEGLGVEVPFLVGLEVADDGIAGNFAGGFDLTGDDQADQVFLTAFADGVVDVEEVEGHLVGHRGPLGSGSVENESAEVFVLDEVAKAGLDLVGGDGDGASGLVGGVEGDVFEDAFEDGVEPASADVLGAAVDLKGQIGHEFDGGVLEDEFDAVSPQKGLVLPQEGGAGLPEDAYEVVAGEVVELDADGEAALELGHEVGRLGAVEGSGGDEEDMVGGDGAVLGVDGGPLDDREQVALNALTGDVGAGAAPSSPATLSISSRKMMPSSWAMATASR